MVKRTESVEEYLARGGRITKVESAKIETNNKNTTVRSTKVGPAVIMSFGEAELMFGEKSKRKKKEKPVGNLSDVPLELIPDDLRKSLGI